MEKDTIREILGEGGTGDPLDPREDGGAWDDQEARTMMCRTCRVPRIFRRRRVRHALHFVLALGTLGFWLPVWGVIILMQLMKPWSCTVCRRRER